MALQLIDKNGNGANIILGEIICNTEEAVSILITDCDDKTETILEGTCLTVAFGEYCENEIETVDHFVTSSIRNGGSSPALKDGQIIVEFKKA